MRTVDLCCGPGDLGRAIRQNYPNAEVDFIDRDPLLLSICRGFNRRAGVPGSYRQLDLNEESWCQGLRARHYDVIAATNAMHWLSAVRAEAVFGDIHRLLDDGGTFFFAEPAPRKSCSRRGSTSGKRGSRRDTSRETGRLSGTGRTPWSVTTTPSSWALGTAAASATE